MSDVDLHLNDTVGFIFIGILFELILYGLSLAQNQYYFREYPNDRLYIQVLVSFVGLCDTARTCCDLHFLWTYLVTNHANPGGLTIFTNSFMAEFFLSSWTVLIVQSYYIHSLWRFMPEKWYRFPLAITMILLALLSFCGGCGAVYDFTLNPAVAASLSSAKIAASIQTVTAVVTDVYIAAALSLVLRGKRTGFTATDSLITKLVAFAIHRGILTASCILLPPQYIGTFKDGANRLVWTLFHFPGSKIYTNSLLAVLNVRHWLRDTPEAIVEEIQFQTSDSGDTTGSRPPLRSARIIVTTEVISDRESRTDRRKSKNGA